MASNGSSIVPADVYRHFFETFKSTVNVNDPLPVKVGSHSIRDDEVDGEIVDWTLQYLQQKNCPSKLLAHLVSLILWEVHFCISKDKDDVDSAVNKVKVYEPVKLMQLVTSKINNVCFEYLNNQKFESLCTELSFSNRPLHPVSVHAIRNGRRKMEDRHVVIQDLNTVCSIRDEVPTSYYAVFDGHAGTDAAFYAASQLHEKLVRNSKFATEPGEALREAFLDTDQAFIQDHNEEKLKGGTTAVVSLIRGNLLLTAWLGDSQAVLVRDGVATQLVNPHKPDRSDEKERISLLGGEVIFWDGAYRVNGQLAVSRAIGDASYKPYVTAEPDMVAVTLEGHEDFLIIGCDGLWDTIGVDEAAFIVLQYLHHETDISGLSGRLVQAAKQKGSSDNISVIVVFFRDPELIARRPLPPVPTSVLTNNTPSMEQQQEEYEKLAAKWGWSEPQGGAVFDESSWQHQTDGQAQQPQNPFDSSNPFGNNGDESGQAQHFYQSTDAVEPGAKWGWNEGAVADGETWSENPQQAIPDSFNGDDSDVGASWPQNDPHHGIPDSFNGDSAETPEVTDGLTAQWGWKDPEIEALEIEAGRDSEHHFAATSVVPLPDHDVDLVEARNQYEKVAAKWGRELEQFDANGADTVTLESRSDFHLSSDGSTWDQTSGNTQPTGVDWNQYDEELSGQPSLIFVGQSDETASTEQIISPIEDLGVNELNGPAITEEDRQMWASEENSVSFPPVEQVEAPAVVDGSFIDEGIAGDEADFTCSSSSVIEAAIVGTQQPDIVAAASAAENDPDFHWNLHAPEFEFRPKEASPSELLLQPSGEVQTGESASSSERKLSATELLIRSSNDAQLAVLLAAANDDPDEMEPQELNISPRSDALDDIHNASNAINESKGDGTIDAEDSEDDWTFSDYRQPETSKEENVTNNGADISAGVDVELDSKVDENCVQKDCQANGLGDQLEKLTVDDLQTDNVIPVSEPVEVGNVADETVADETVAVIEQVVEEVQSNIDQTVDETQSMVVSSTIQESEPVLPPVEADAVAKEAEVTSTQETVEPRLAESPVSDSATVGSDTAALVVTGTAIGVVGAVAATAAATAPKAKSPVAKKPIASTAAKKTAPAKPVAKEPTKKLEPTTRRVPTTEAKGTVDAAKPARPTKLSPLRKATPAASSTTPAKPTTAPRTTLAAKPTASKPTASKPTAPATKPAASATTATVKKTTTTTVTRTTTTSTTPAKRVPSAPSTNATAKAPTPAKPASTGAATARTTTASATSSTPTRRTVSASSKITSTTSRPATSTATKTAAATTNGDIKPKPTTTTSTTRTAAKPTVNGTATKTAPAPRPTAAAKTATTTTTSTRPAPLKSVAARTATPHKPTGSTASKTATASKVGAGTPSRRTKPTASTAASTATTAAAAPLPAADTPQAAAAATDGAKE